jgi:hypothetical protein
MDTALQNLIDQCSDPDVEPLITDGEYEGVLLRHRPSGGLSYLLVEDEDLNARLVSHLKAVGARHVQPEDFTHASQAVVEDEG